MVQNFNFVAYHVAELQQWVQTNLISFRNDNSCQFSEIWWKLKMSHYKAHFQRYAVNFFKNCENMINKKCYSTIWCTLLCALKLFIFHTTYHLNSFIHHLICIISFFHRYSIYLKIGTFQLIHDQSSRFAFSAQFVANWMDNLLQHNLLYLLSYTIFI